MSRLARPTVVGPGPAAQHTAAMATRPQSPLFAEGADVFLSVREAASNDLLLVDEVILRVDRRITRGGMAGTYEARVVAAKGEPPREFIGRRVVLKVADSAEFAVNEWGHLREFRHMSVLPEPYVFGIVRPKGGSGGAASDTPARHAIVMEFIEGKDMASWAFDWERDRGTPPPLESVLDAMNPVLDFMKVASTARPPLVHRDIKPENLIVQDTPAGFRCRLIDLGISERTTDAEDRRGSLGTRGFAPPEVLGARSGAEGGARLDDPRVDTFGLAATLYSVLSGGVYDYSWRGGFPIAHDDVLRKRVKDAFSEQLPQMYGMTAAPSAVARAVEKAFDQVDAEVLAAIKAGLESRQEMRPTPGEFADSLPRSRMESLLELHAASVYPALLAGDAGAATGGPARFVDAGVDIQRSTLSDALRYEGFEDDFVRAMDAWNRGRYFEAVPLLRKLADAGDVTSQYNLGICIRDGLGGAEGSPAEVFWRWSKAAEEGHIVAMYNVGLCLESGYGVPQGGGGVSVAKRWYRRAADEGFPLAIKRLAELEPGSNRAQ